MYVRLLYPQTSPDYLHNWIPLVIFYMAGKCHFHDFTFISLISGQQRLKTHHVAGHPFQTLQVTEVQQHRRGIVRKCPGTSVASSKREGHPILGIQMSGPRACPAVSLPTMSGRGSKIDLGVGWYWIIAVRWDVVSKKMHGFGNTGPLYKPSEIK